MLPKNKNTKELFPLIVQELCAARLTDNLAQQYAWWLFEAVTNKKKIDLLTDAQLFLNDREHTKLIEYMHRIVHTGEPIQYILGIVPFNDVMINIEPPILIPRPETEEWIGTIITQLILRQAQDDARRSLTILDLCTGSGCIAINLAHSLPDAQIYAADIDPVALKLAQKNATLNNVTINFFQSDLFGNLPPEQHYDLIVTNPPYIAYAELPDLETSVTAWEAHHALFAHDDGLALIKKIIEQAPSYLKKNDSSHQDLPQLMIEIGHKQGEIVKQLMLAANFANVHIYKDLAGKDRVVVGSL